MLTPRTISSDGQGTITPHTANLVKSATTMSVEGSTPRVLDRTHSPWATLGVDTSTIRTESRIQGRESESNLPAFPQAQPSPAFGSPTSTTVPDGTLPERYTSDLVHWQSQSDLPERRMMVQRIIALTRSKMLQNTPSSRHQFDGNDRAPSLAKRIELSLYSRAASFYEYRDLNTLRRRLQSLVSLSFHEAAASKRAALIDSTLGKRKYGTQFGITRLNIKRPRVAVEKREKLKRESFFIMNEDVLHDIFSFLSGKQTIQCVSINKFTQRVLPKCVVSLKVEVKQLKRGFEMNSTNLLCRYPNLEKLHIYNENRVCDEKEAGLALHAWGCSELDLSHGNIGEQVIMDLTESIEMGACRALKEMRLVSVFNNTCRNNALHLLCTALVKGSCPDLEHLLLGGNGISDVGTVDIAWLLRVGSLPKLSRLDLRRNYVGEAGINRIMTALLSGHCQQLKYLCVGGNIITDNCVAPVVKVLASASCPQMRFLGLEDNFLSTRGVDIIIRGAVAGGMMPKLHHVASEMSTS